MAYIYKHYQDNMTLKDVAGMLYISPQYFCTIFKEATGCTFNDYVNKIRINQSMLLLKESDKKNNPHCNRMWVQQHNEF